MKAIFFLSAIFFFSCNNTAAQQTPKCIDSMMAKANKDKESYKQKRIWHNTEYLGTFKLPNGETVYKTKVEMMSSHNASTGITYYDANCNKVASFSASKRDIKEGYKAEWFPESKTSPTPKPNPNAANQDSLKKVQQYEKSKAYFSQFDTPVKYRVTAIHEKQNPLKLSQNDIIKVSLKNGMIVYRKGKKINQYKLKPTTKTFTTQPQCAKPPCPPITETKDYFSWGSYSIQVNNSSINMTPVLGDKKSGPPQTKVAVGLKWFSYYTIQKI